MALARDVAAARPAFGGIENPGAEASRRRTAKVVTFVWPGGLLGLMLRLGMAARPSVHAWLSLRLRSKDSGRLATAVTAPLWIVLHVGVQEPPGPRLFHGLWRGRPGT